ncbi:MAG: PIN domain-containing protein [Halobacteriota archaeon]
MGWIENLRGQVVGLDTTPLIYFIEENPTYLDTVRPFFVALDRGEFRVVTSIVTLLEVLVHPFRHNDTALVQQYREILLNAEYLTTMVLTHEIAEEAARLRAEHNIRTPDAIQLATAIHEGASFFLSNDARLPPLPTLQILVLDELEDT